MKIIEDLRSAPWRLTNVGENAEKLMLKAADEIEIMWKLINQAEPAMLNSPPRDRVRDFIIRIGAQR